MNAPRREKRDVHGWLVLDKPVGTTSTVAVAILKRGDAQRSFGRSRRCCDAAPALWLPQFRSFSNCVRTASSDNSLSK